MAHTLAISMTCKQFAVIGNPIEQSRSPELHHAFAAKMGIELEYHKRFAELDAFEQSVKDFFAEGGIGMNVTVPFKERAFALCEQRTTRANIAKAVNTLYLQDGQLVGDNTDGQGLVAAIQAHAWRLNGAKILVIGAGGATRGVIYPLAQAGVVQIDIANRTLSRAEQLIDDLVSEVPNCTLQAYDLDSMTGHYDIVINATSASLSGDALVLPESLSFDHAYEMAYGKASSFLEQAKARGAQTSEGFGMLVGQAIESFRIWNGVEPALKDFLGME